jgi:hypothetical protein
MLELEDEGIKILRNVRNNSVVQTLFRVEDFKFPQNCFPTTILALNFTVLYFQLSMFLFFNNHHPR